MQYSELHLIAIMQKMTPVTEAIFNGTVEKEVIPFNA